MMLTFEKAFEKYKAYMIRCNYSKVTLFKKEEYLKRFYTWLQRSRQDAYNDLRAISCDDLQDYMDSLFVEDIQPYTIKIYIAHLKSFFGFLCKHDLMGSDPTRKLPSIKCPRKEVVFVPHKEIIDALDNMLFKFEKKSILKIAMRNYYIIRVAYVTGWRASESLACNPDEDIDWETGEIHIPRRKGGKDGYVYMDMETTNMLKSWYYSNYPNGKFLWYSRDGKQLSYEAYNGVFIKYLGKSSHRVRASLATYLIGQGVDIVDVAGLLGHENIATTMRYIGRGKKTLKNVHSKKNPFSV